MKKCFSYILVVFAVALVGCKQEEYFKNEKGPYEGFPELGDTTNTEYQYVTHTITLREKTRRNYTLCYDKTKYAAQWVAYPLHKCYIGSNSRTDVWEYDPNIDKSCQHSTSSYGQWGIDRGHQIPSADRTATTEMNAQTFYVSNMTPQNSKFNQGIWVGLESRVRSQYMCKDTLYVVTGAYWGEGHGYVNGYPKPTHYYKLFLRTRSGNTGKTVYAKDADLICIGIWLDQETTDQAVTAKHCKSVAEIEDITGFEFFTNVDVDKTQCNVSDWGF